MTETSASVMATDSIADPGTWLVRYSPGGSGSLPRLEVLSEPLCWIPTVAETPVAQVLFDGVLFNRAELCRQLDQSPEATDASVVLHAYLRWGEELFQHLRGVFSLLVVDRRHGALLGARDQLGILPLFYAVLGDDLLFSPCIEAILAHPRVSKDLNRAVLADHLCDRWPDPHETYFTAVRRVLPGHIMRVEHGRIVFSLYWRLPVPDPTDHQVRESDIEEFDRLLDQAVGRCLRVGQPGILLSGGIDSVSVALSAVQGTTTGRLPGAFSLDFHEVAFDEVMIQREVAAQLGLPFTLIPIEEAVPQGNLVRSGLQMISSLPAPGPGIWYSAYQTLQGEARRQGCSVILTGIGGDEWQVASRAYIPELLLARDFRGFLQLWHTASRSFHHSARETLQLMVWTYGLHPLLRLAIQRTLLSIAPGLMRARWRRSHERTTPPWVAPDPELRRLLAQRAEARWPRAAPRGPYDVLRDALALDSAIVSMEMEEGYESSRRLGMRMLHPLLDIDLVEFLWQAPVELMNLGGITKGLARRRLARAFPDLGFDKQRKESAVPYAGPLLRTQGGEAWARIGGAHTLSKLGIVDGLGVSHRVQEIAAQSDHFSPHQLWTILSLEAWTKARYNAN